MRTLKNLFVVAVGLVMSFQTYAVNITMNDGVGYGTGWYSANWENNEVEPTCATTQPWDLESMDLTGGVLTLTGGYNFRNGYQNMMSGDIFVKLKGSSSWDYVFDVNGLSYDLVNLNDSLNQPDKFRDVYYHRNAASNPWRYLSGGEVIGTGNVSYLDPTLDGEGYHYSMVLDINEILGSVYDTGATFHYTMQCGNDNLVGRVPPQGVPEPGSALASILAGLLGIAIFRRKQ